MVIFGGSWSPKFHGSLKAEIENLSFLLLQFILALFELLHPQIAHLNKGIGSTAFSYFVLPLSTSYRQNPSQNEGESFFFLSSFVISFLAKSLDLSLPCFCLFVFFIVDTIYLFFSCQRLLTAHHLGCLKLELSDLVLPFLFFCFNHFRFLYYSFKLFTVFIPSITESGVEIGFAR